MICTCTLKTDTIKQILQEKHFLYQTEGQNTCLNIHGGRQTLLDVMRGGEIARRKRSCNDIIFVDGAGKA